MRAKYKITAINRECAFETLNMHIEAEVLTLSELDKEAKEQAIRQFQTHDDEYHGYRLQKIERLDGVISYISKVEV
jgi:hypothetical protein